MEVPLHSDSARLQLDALASGCHALTKAKGESLAECATVCFYSQGHSQNVMLSVKGSHDVMRQLDCPQITEQMLRCYHDLEEAAEDGACGVAILLIRHLEGLTVVKRSRKGTGIDYWMGHKDNSGDPFKEMARLEVSGLLKPTDSQFSQRVKQKILQAKQSEGTKLPYYVVVVEFSTPRAKVVTDNGIGK